MDYQDKYFKYKLKYLKTKLLKEKQKGGSLVDTQNSILLAIVTVTSLYNIYKKTKNKFHKNLKNTINLSKKTDDKKISKKLKRLKELSKKSKKQYIYIPCCNFCLKFMLNNFLIIWNKKRKIIPVTKPEFHYLLTYLYTVPWLSINKKILPKALCRNF
jgi:hypothetical protein